MRVGEAGVEFDRLLERCDRLRQSCAPEIGHATVRVGSRLPGVDGDGLAIRRQGAVQVALLHQRESQFD